MALTQSTPLPFPATDNTEPVVQPLQQDILVEFAEQFTKLQGKFAFCQDEQELKEQFEALRAQQGWTKVFKKDDLLPGLVDASHITSDLVHCDASVTDCEALVARTGSLVLSAANSGGRLTSVYAPVHVCVAYASQLVYDISDALTALQQKYKGQLPSLVTFATGPSRTADIEKTLVTGVHGPKEVYLFLIDDLGATS
ncbi:LutC/YkgG family protein [Flaviaesturariibacter amylovorans]|uniref:Lactate utilization protein n=1 Tax=Flaviaesturariibacter amylovorans TaxID=1084520 RepID=A0ABP8GB61_9BACT